MKNNKPTILIFSLAYHPFVGGAEVAIKEITDRLGNSFDFDMVTVNLDGQQKKEERVGNINVHRIGKRKICKYVFPLAGYLYAKKLHGKNNYDIAWAMMANQSGWAAMKFKKKFPRTQYLLTLQEGDSELDIWLRTFFIRPIYKNIYKRADHVQAISNFLKKRAENFGIKNKIDVVPNGIKKELPVTSEDKIAKQIITTSRLVKKNGIKYLIEAIQGVDGNLIILGGGKLKPKLEKLRDKLNLTNKVIFKGEVSNDDVYKYVSQSAVFVRPSLSEGLGNAFLEAMAMKVPVVATPVGGIPDFLREEETGWFCEVKNSKSIAEKINYVLDPKNQEEVEKVVENANKMVVEGYNWSKISIDMKNIFNKLSNE